MQEVKLIARRIHERLPASVALDDLISAGVVGLISAVDSYETGHEVNFKTYAESKIRSAILNSLGGMTLAPLQQHKRAKLIEAAISVLEYEKDHIATEEEIASQLHLSIEEYQAWLSELRGLSLGILENVGSEDHPWDLLVYQSDSDPHSLAFVVERVEFERLLGDVIATIPRPERIVLDHYYYEQLTFAEIAKRLELPESRVGQLKSQAIIRLRSHLSRRHLRTTEIATHSRAPQAPSSHDANLTEAKEKDRLALLSAGGMKSSVSHGFEGSESGRDVRSLVEDPTVGILMATAAAFQDLETGRLWLFTPSSALGNVVPVSLISTAAGRDIVANELGLIEHGMY